MEHDTEYFLQDARGVFAYLCKRLILQNFTISICFNSPQSGKLMNLNQ